MVGVKMVRVVAAYRHHWPRQPHHDRLLRGLTLVILYGRRADPGISAEPPLSSLLIRSAANPDLPHASIQRVFSSSQYALNVITPRGLLFNTSLLVFRVVGCLLCRFVM